MKEFILEFLKILTNCVLLICLGFTAFLLIVNFYHSESVKYQYSVDLKNNYDYQQYLKTLDRIDSKMNSVSKSGSDYALYARPIYDYYSNCMKKLKSGTFYELNNGDGLISTMDIYNSNNEIINNYNNICSFAIPYNISNLYGKKSSSFEDIEKFSSEKREIIADNARYLTKSGYGNSAYSFATDTFRGTVYNQTVSEFGLTIENYKMIASILEDIADWYVLEFGGNS